MPSVTRVRINRYEPAGWPPAAVKLLGASGDEVSAGGADGKQKAHALWEGMGLGELLRVVVLRCCSVALASQLFDRVSKVDDARGGVKPQIVFLVAALPAVVGPEIALGLPAYRRLKQLEVAVGELPLGGLLGMVGDRHEVGLVVSASYAAHVDVEDCLPGASHNLLGAREHRRIVVEEVEPVVDVVPEGYLVGYISHDDRLVLGTVACDASQGFCHGYALGSEARAQMQEESVELLILQYMVYLCALCSLCSP